MKWIIGILAMLLLIPAVSAEIQVSPENINVNLTGGENRTVNIIVLYVGGESSVVGYSHYEATEGLTIEMQDKFILEPSVPVVIPIKFVSMPNLAPEVYSVSIWFTYSVEEVVRTETKTVYTGGGVYVEVDTYDDAKLNETLSSLFEWRKKYYDLLAENGTIINISETDIQPFLDEIGNLRWELLEIEINYDMLKEELDEKDRNIQEMQIAFALILIILIIVSIVLVSYIKKDKRNR